MHLFFLAGKHFSQTFLLLISERSIRASSLQRNCVYPILLLALLLLTVVTLIYIFLQQTRFCTTWPSFPFTCRLLFIISTHKLVVSLNFVSMRSGFSAHFLFWEILNLTLTFDVYVEFNLSSNANLTTFHPTLDWPHCDWKSQASRVIPGILVIPFIPITLVNLVVLYPSHSSNPSRPNRPYHLALSIYK